MSQNRIISNKVREEYFLLWAIENGKGKLLQFKFDAVVKTMENMLWLIYARSCNINQEL